MFRILVMVAFNFFLLGCSGLSIKKPQSSLDDQSFKTTYIRYSEAQSEHLSNFSKESRKNYIELAKQLLPFAESGNPVAQLAYGESLLYESPRSYKKWLLKSAGNDHLPALRKLATFYRTGQHVGKDLDKAVDMIKNNANYGHASDIAVLAVLYRTGKGVQKSPETYYSLMIESAFLGSLSSQRSLGQDFRDGYGGEKDLIRAYAWYAISTNNKKGPKYNESVLQSIEAIKKRLSGDQVNDALDLVNSIEKNITAKTTELIDKAKSGDLTSQRIYGHRSFIGDNFIEKNYILAATWLSIAINNPLNKQVAYDKSRLILALNRLNEDELKKVQNNLQKEKEFEAQPFQKLR